MPTRLTLICHGAIAAMRSSVFGGEGELEAKSVAQACKLAGMLGKPAHLLAAPAQQAIDTARLIGGEPTIDDGLRDLGFGAWTGQTLAAIQAAEPQALGRWLSEPSFTPDGGESIEGVIARAGTWLAATAATGGTVHAVSHPAFIRAAVVAALDAPAAAFWRIDVEPLALTSLTHDGRRWALRLAAGAM